MKKNILLTGRTSAGKTEVIKKVIEKFKVPAKGFYTEQERAASIRVGFVIITLDGRRCRLAHRDIHSPYKIREYGISVANIETVAVTSIFPVDTDIIILDGIEKMACFSEVFKKAVIKALNSTNIVIGAASLGGNDFIMEIKNRRDVEIHEVTWNNRRLIPDFILERISDLLKP